MSPDVKIDFLDSLVSTRTIYMTTGDIAWLFDTYIITIHIYLHYIQIVSQEGTRPLTFIDNNVVVFPTFTSREYVTTKNGVVAFTCVPINLFDYNSWQSSIAITGKIVLKLVDSGRKLKADIGAKFDASEEASFEIEVDLQREIMFEDETSMNSAASVASSKGIIAYAMVLAWTYAIW